MKREDMSWFMGTHIIFTCLFVGLFCVPKIVEAYYCPPLEEVKREISANGSTSLLHRVISNFSVGAGYKEQKELITRRLAESEQGHQHVHYVQMCHQINGMKDKDDA